MMTREQLATSYRRLAGQRDEAAAGTPERLRAEVNLHMSRWALRSNGFSAADIAKLERTPLYSAELRARLRQQISPEMYRFIRRAIYRRAPIEPHA